MVTQMGTCICSGHSHFESRRLLVVAWHRTFSFRQDLHSLGCVSLVFSSRDSLTAARSAEVVLCSSISLQSAISFLLLHWRSASWKWSFSQFSLPAAAQEALVMPWSKIFKSVTYMSLQPHAIHPKCHNWTKCPMSHFFNLILPPWSVYRPLLRVCALKLEGHSITWWTMLARRSSCQHWTSTSTLQKQCTTSTSEAWFASLRNLRRSSLPPKAPSSA